MRPDILLDDDDHEPLEDAARLKTLYTRRLNNKHGTMATIKLVASKDLEDDDYEEEENDRAEHRAFPNPHSYTVRVMDRGEMDKFGCRCAHGCKLDPVTHQAEVKCRCGNYNVPPGDYFEESNDRDTFYVADEKGGSQKQKTLITQSVFGGNPYKIQ